VRVLYIFEALSRGFGLKDFLPTARSAVGLGITFSTFTPSIASFGHLVIWSFGNFIIFLPSTQFDVSRRYLTVLDDTRRYFTLLHASQRYSTRFSTLFDAARRRAA
jgi:hypothetical protein